MFSCGFVLCMVMIIELCLQACNVIECGFDAGDCGTEKYDQLHGFMLAYNQTHYDLPKGMYKVHKH